MLQEAERELVVRAVQPFAKVGPQRGPAQRELAARPIDSKLAPAVALVPVEPVEGRLVASGGWSEVDMEDGHFANNLERMPPPLPGRCHDRDPPAGAKVTSRR